MSAKPWASTPVERRSDGRHFLLYQGLNPAPARNESTITAITQIALIAAYALAALALGAGLTQVAGVAPLIAALLGALLFLAAVLLQEALNRRRQGRQTQAALSRAGEQLAALKGRLVAAEKSLTEVRATIDQAEGWNSDQMVAEMHTMQGLLERLAERSRSRRQVKSDGPLGDRIRTAAPAALAKSLSNEEILEITQQGLEQNRVDLYLQPVVSLPERKVRFYETFSRIRNDQGNVILPEQYLSLAAEQGLLADIDNMLLFRCVQLIRRAQIDKLTVGFFCNLASESLNDNEFFPQFIEFMRANEALADNLVFELAQSDIMNAGIERNLKALARLGFTFSLDKVSDLSFNFAGLAKRGFRFLKVLSAVLRDRANYEDLPFHIDDYKNAVNRAGLQLVAEKVEEESEVIDLLDLGIDLGQGFLFGEPRPSREVSA
ncbi:MAG: EAL domain-containing protein [Alphaproteobacteria bacterium]|nr:EAL domain-containing protein [Alphaproteobacteria bacterium]